MACGRILSSLSWDSWSVPKLNTKTRTHEDMGMGRSFLSRDGIQRCPNWRTEVPGKTHNRVKLIQLMPQGALARLCKQNMIPGDPNSSQILTVFVPWCLCIFVSLFSCRLWQFWVREYADSTFAPLCV
jgi:hypothetical protein